MQSLQFNQLGKTDVLELSQIPSPYLRTEHDLLLELKATEINPLDTKWH